MESSNSIHINDDILAVIEDMSSCLMSPGEIAISIGMTNEQFKHILEHKKDHPVYISFQKGRIKTKLEIHRMVIKLAQKGSPQAEILAEKYLKEQNNESL